MEISLGKTRILPRIGAGFMTRGNPCGTKCTHPGVAAGFADGGLGGHVPTGPECITPHIRFLFIAPRFRLGSPKHPASRRRTCPSTNLRLTFGSADTWYRDLHPAEFVPCTAHAFEFTGRRRRSGGTYGWAVLVHRVRFSTYISRSASSQAPLSP